MPPGLVLYTTTHCGPCRRLKRQLDEAAIDYSEVNVEFDDSAAEWVMTINAGDRTVPTVRFPDGSALTNPSVDAVRAKLASKGS